MLCLGSRVKPIAVAIFFICAFNSIGQTLFNGRGDSSTYNIIREGSGHLDIMFSSEFDSVRFEVQQRDKNKLYRGLEIKVSSTNGRLRHVRAFNGNDCSAYDATNDSLIFTFSDLPYGHLIINYLSKKDQVENNSMIDRLDCLITIDGVTGIPDLYMYDKAPQIKKSKKVLKNEILFTTLTSDKTFCSLRKFSPLQGGPEAYTLSFNRTNTPHLNERLRIAMLFLLWIYEKDA